MVWACEFSPAQGAFHVDTLERILEMNRKTVARGEAPSYVPLALFRSSEEAHVFTEKWRKDHPWKEAEAAIEGAALRLTVWDIMSELPKDQQAALYRRYWLNLPLDEAGRKAHDAALRTLRHPSRSKALRQML